MHGNPVSAAPFAAFFQGRELSRGGAASLVIQAQPPAVEERAREVFISYAWQVCDDFIESLYLTLEREGFQPVRDRSRMRPGEFISDFIRSLIRAPKVVAVIGEKYLRSAYCMNELHGLWRIHQDDPKLLAERLVPIVLSEVTITGVRDRAPYVRFWKAQLAELEALERELGIDLGPESQEEIRRVRQFAEDVDRILVFLQDVLMPRGVQAHLDGGFEAVLEALRRRI